MLAILTIIACPIDLSACRRERLTVSGGYATAQQVVAEWIADGHEAYRVTEWRFAR